MSCWDNKRPYTKREAQEAQNRLRRKGRLVRIYRCGCNAWHLTHQELHDHKQPEYLKKDKWY